ncbi:MAG TPA: 5-deoxy-glucuronate isomerase, partial [Bryobacteraceae bacterium]
MSALLVRPEVFRDRMASFNYEYLSFEVRKMARGVKYEGATGNRELAIVWLGGVSSVKSSKGEWARVGGRATVFEGLPYTLYLPVASDFTITAETDSDLAFCYCRAEEEKPARLVTPGEVRVEIRGGGNATRQIHHMLPPEFPAQRLLVVEVFTPAGNWSSYPPHKH